MEKVTPKFGRRIVVYEPGIIHEWPSQGCERYSISPVLLKQESFGIFDDNLIIVEDYLSDSEILESEQFLELKRKEKEYFRSHYPKRQLG
ncbi:MAG: hypothetical protein J6X95_06050, partial [Treponema sp.]|nr:hypothetical protein [Treponema sp.]